VLTKYHGGQPPKLTSEEATDAQHLCGVMTPIAIATRVLERDTEETLGSHYEPMMQSVIAQCAPTANTPKPRGGAAFGSEWPANRKSKYLGTELTPLAARFKAFLHRDQQHTLQKHLLSSTGLKWLRMASYFDPRHKDLCWLTTEEYEAVVHDVRVEVLKLHQHFNSDAGPAAAPKPKPKAAAKKGPSPAEAPVPPEDPEEEVLGDLGRRERAKHAKTRGAGRGGKGRGRGGRGQAAAAAPAAPVRELQAQSSEESFDEAALLRGIRPAAAEAAAPAVASATNHIAEIKKALEDWKKEPVMPKQSPLEYWRKRARNGTANPWLLLFIRHVFSIPGSNAALERAFSHAGRAITPKRSSLAPTRAADTIFLHENYIRGILV